MSLSVKTISEIIEEYAPLSLKESYDNVGLMVGCLENEVSSMLVCLDCSDAVIDEAIDKGCSLILTHHPLLFHSPKSITSDTNIGRKIIKLVKNDISVYSSHTNLDSTFGGLNDILMKLLGFSDYEVIEPSHGLSLDSKAGIGRVASLNSQMTFDELCTKVKEALHIENLRYCGSDEKKISKVAVINGSGKDYFEAVKGLGVDCIITGDTSYHFVYDCLDMNIAVIDAGHFETEWPCMKFVAEFIKNRIVNMGFDSSVLISEFSRSPYKYK
jgi:dinuclear metal center YbgI/SA1388 family protein